MKFRAYVLVVALIVSSVVPYSVAQDTQKPADTTTSPAADSQTRTDTPAPTKDSKTKDSKKDSKSAQNLQSKDSSLDEPVQQSANPPKETHNKNINDINDIGNRKIGGRGIGDWYSLEKEIAMGKEYAAQVESTVKLVQDPVVTEYVNRIGQNLVRNSDAQVPFTIKVIDADDVNAFALPGGFFYVNSGLILAADNEAELAGVMAHEIAHVAARHAMRQMTRMNIARLATIPLIFVPMGAGAYYGIQSAASLALPLTFMKFSRGFEAQADYLGLQYMYKAGYDPQSFISFFEKIQALEKKKPGTLAKAFESHPQTPDRIEKSQEEIANVLPARAEYIVDTSEFDQVKARLAAIENRRKLTSPDDKDHPTLRRTANGNDKNGKDNGDGRPTLKRRDND
jgi:predicted Zn-dependent protease